MRYNTLKKKHQNIGKGKEKTNHLYFTGWITKDADQRGHWPSQRQGKGILKAPRAATIRLMSDYGSQITSENTEKKPSKHGRDQLQQLNSHKFQVWESTRGYTQVHGRPCPLYIKGLLTESEVSDCSGKVFAWGFRTGQATKERGLCEKNEGKDFPVQTEQTRLIRLLLYSFWFIFFAVLVFRCFRLSYLWASWFRFMFTTVRHSFVSPI